MPVEAIAKKLVKTRRSLDRMDRLFESADLARLPASWREELLRVLDELDEKVEEAGMLLRPEGGDDA